MASIRKHGTGWRAQVYRNGIRRSKVFPSKRAAQDWASRQEYLIENSDAIASAQPFADVLLRYAREVSPTKRGMRWEILRLEAMSRGRLGKIPIGQLTAADFADWRDRRLREVAAGTVRREMVLISAVLSQARREWGLISVSPMADVRKPSSPPPRDRLPTAEEMERLAHAAGDDLTNATARAYHAFLFACETAMRAGEIVGLTAARVDLGARVAHLERTKNGRSRTVPLSTEAVMLLEALPPCDPIFGLTSRQLDALWRKIRERAGVEGLRFHDSRAEGCLRLSRRLDVLDLARCTGHMDLKMLISTYYRESAAEIAKRLG